MIDEIKQLERDIEYEQMQFDTAEKYPTYTAQYYKALVKQKVKLSEMKQKLKELKNVK
jgi:hypothetical protein